MKKVLVLSLLILASCGKQGSGSPATTTPLKPVTPGTAYQAVLIAGLMPTSTGVSTMVQPSVLTLPNPSDITVTLNATDFYHATLIAGSVTCDYTHNVGTTTFVNGAGCTTTGTTVSLNTGDTVTLSVNGTVTQITKIQVTLNLVGY